MTSRRIPDYLLVFDLEAAGLSTDSVIFEIGAILVEGTPPFRELGRANMILHPGTDRTQLWGTMPAVVREMHERTGLWAETAQDGAWSLVDADKALRDWIVGKTGGGVPRPMIAMAGTGVAAFDLQLVRAQMPHVASVLHYRPLDTSPIHTLLEIAGRHDLVARFAAEPAHRALPDCQRGLDELRLFAELFGQLPSVADSAAAPPATPANADAEPAST